MREFVFNLDAGQELPINEVGTLIHVRQASSNIKLRIQENDRLSELEAHQGVKLKTSHFQSLSVINESDNPITGKLLVGTGDFSDDNISGSVQMTAHSLLVPKASVTLNSGQTHTIAENAGRKRLTLLSHPDNAGMLWLSDAVNKGVPLVGGAWREIDITGAVQVTSDSAGQKLFVDEVL